MHGNQTWTDEQDAELKRLWPTKSASEIGLALGKTRNSVIGRFHRLQGDYANYISPKTLEIKAVRDKARSIRRAKEAKAIEQMKGWIANGISRDTAIRLARDSARLKAIGDVFGITGERVRQISEASA